MPLDPWVIPTARVAASLAVRNRRHVRALWKSTVNALSGSGERLLLAGPAGAGKTVLFHHITGEAYKQGYSVPSKSVQMERGKFKTDRSAAGLYVIPGQDSPAKLTALDKLSTTRKAPSGVIFVAANGYVSLRETGSEEALVASGINTLTRFLKAQRERELAELDQVASWIRENSRRYGRPQWLLVAVSKSDLYPDDLAKAKRRYSPHGSGPFVNRLQELQAQIGSDNFEWDALPVCCRREPFQFAGETIDPQIDDNQRDALLEQFSGSIASYVGR